MVESSLEAKKPHSSGDHVMWFHYDWTIMSRWMPKTEIYVVDFWHFNLKLNNAPSRTLQPKVPSKQTNLISSTSFVSQILQKHTSLWEKNTNKNKHLWPRLHLFYPFTIQRFQHLLRHPKNPTWPTVSSSATTPEISRPGSRYLRKPMIKASPFTKAVFLGGGGGTWVGWLDFLR